MREEDLYGKNDRHREEINSSREVASFGPTDQLSVGMDRHRLDHPNLHP